MDYSNNIRSLYEKCSKETKAKVLMAIIEHPKIEASDPVYIKQSWIWKKKVPEYCQPFVVEILQKALMYQIKEVESIVKKIKIPKENIVRP